MPASAASGPCSQIGGQFTSRIRGVTTASPLPRRFPTGKRPFTGQWIISGVTRDSGAAPLGNCVVRLFSSQTEQFIRLVTSDSITGAYSFTLGGDERGTFYVVFYKDGVTPVGGTSLRTLAGAPVG